MHVGRGQEIEKATQTMVVSAGLGPGCWVLSDPNSTSYLFLWSASINQGLKSILIQLLKQYSTRSKNNQ